MSKWITPLLTMILLMAGPAAADLILYDHGGMKEVRRDHRAGSSEFAPGIEALLAEADRALGAGPFSVTFKEEVPPSGDKRDYMSQGPYWWPNPDTKDGLPYVNRDGERNPEADALDRRPLGRMASAVERLALGYFYGGREEHAEKAAELLRVWFLAEETGMNPHLEYGQRIPGRTEGRGIGIIDTRSLMPIGDMATLLLESPAWTEEDHAALQEWFRAYLDWLLESDHGRDERRHHNNHGTWYDAQVAVFALFVGDEERVRGAIDIDARERIGKHITPDGRQPHELSRTLPAQYSLMNLEGFIELASMGERIGADLWNHETADGRGIRAAIDYLLPYARQEKEWKYTGIRGPQWARLATTLRRAGIAYEAPEYEALLHELLGEDAPAHRVNLLHPPKEEEP